MTLPSAPIGAFDNNRICDVISCQLISEDSFLALVFGKSQKNSGVRWLGGVRWVGGVGLGGVRWVGLGGIRWVGGWG